MAQCFIHEQNMSNINMAALTSCRTQALAKLLIGAKKRRNCGSMANFIVAEDEPTSELHTLAVRFADLA